MPPRGNGAPNSGVRGAFPGGPGDPTQRSEHPSRAHPEPAPEPGDPPRAQSERKPQAQGSCGPGRPGGHAGLPGPQLPRGRRVPPLPRPSRVPLRPEATRGSARRAGAAEPRQPLCGPGAAQTHPFPPAAVSSRARRCPLQAARPSPAAPDPPRVTRAPARGCRRRGGARSPGSGNLAAERTAAGGGCRSRIPPTPSPSPSPTWSCSNCQSPAWRPGGRGARPQVSGLWGLGRGVSVRPPAPRAGRVSLPPSSRKSHPPPPRFPSGTDPSHVQTNSVPLGS